MTKSVTQADRQKRYDQHLLWAIAVCISLILITPLIRSTSTLFPSIVGKAIFARSIIEVSFTLWIVLILYYPKYRPSRSWIIISLSIGMTISVVTGLTGVSPIRSMWSTFERMNGVIDQAHWLAFILVTSSIYRSLFSWRVLFSLNLGIASMISVIGLGEYYGSLDPLVSEGLYHYQTNYIKSTLGNASFMGAYTMVNSVLGIGLALHASYRRRQTELISSEHTYSSTIKKFRSKLTMPYLLQGFWLLSSILCLCALWFTASRGALFGLGLGIIVLLIGYIFCTKKRTSTRIIYTIFLLVSVMLSLIALARTPSVREDITSSNPMIWRLFGSKEDSDTASLNRRDTSKIAYNAYTDKPILGWGPENYLVPWGRYSNFTSDDKPLPFDSAHSYPIEELITKGTLGLLSYLIIWSIIWIIVVRSIRRRSTHKRFLVMVVGAALLALFAQSFLMVQTASTTLQLSLLIAFVVSEERKGRIDAKSFGDKAQNVIRRASNWKKVWLIVPIVIATIWSLYNLNYRAYQAAQASRESLITDLWDDMATNFTRSVDAFPPLANIPRRLMIERLILCDEDYLGQCINNLHVANLSLADYEQAINLVAQEGRAALHSEPQNWRFHVALAQFYQQAYLRDQEYRDQEHEYSDQEHKDQEHLELAGIHVQEAILLAPNISQTINIKAEQERLEQQTKP